jgi:4-hydroxyproline epimerase
MAISRTPGKQSVSKLRVIDSHTGGEPTRVVVEGEFDLGSGSMQLRREALSQRFDWLRTCLVTEPRGAAWMVGAALQRPVNPDNSAGAIFFNNVGYLGMCGHGLIGVVAALNYLGQARPGALRIETPVGEVQAWLEEDESVSFENVASYRLHKDVAVDVPGCQLVGDVAWGGNWFFLAHVDETWMHSSVERLTDLAGQVRAALKARGIAGPSGEEIDHIEFFGKPSDPSIADSRSFVLCPGGQYDRSPCGTGTSAKLACLAADGLLQPGETWRQESIIGSVFHAAYRRTDESGVIVPKISGRAFVTSDLSIVIDPTDPFCFGIPAELVSPAS